MNGSVNLGEECCSGYLKDNCIESILGQKNVLVNELSVALLNICCGTQDGYQCGSNIVLPAVGSLPENLIWMCSYGNLFSLLSICKGSFHMGILG